MQSLRRRQEINFAETWEKIRTQLYCVLTLTPVLGTTIVEDVYRICTSPGKNLNETFYNSIKAFFEQHVTSINHELADVDTFELPDLYLTKWFQYQKGCSYCSHIFRYLNVHWIKNKMEESSQLSPSLYPNQTSASRSVKEISQLGIVTWRTHLFDLIKSRLTPSVLEKVRLFRETEYLDRHLVGGIIQSFLTLGSMKSHPLKIYQQDFEVYYLKATSDYYSIESSNYLADCGVSMYLKKAQERLLDEERVAREIIPEDSIHNVLDICNNVMITAHLERLMGECVFMLNEDRQTDLGNLHFLLARIDSGINLLANDLYEYIVKVGLEAIKSAKQGGLLLKTDSTSPSFDANVVITTEDAETYVETLLKVYHKYNDLIKATFNNNAKYSHSLDKALRKIVNDNCIAARTSYSPELIAKYCDYLLKKGPKLDEMELENKFTDCILLFKFVDDKDVFRKFYSNLLTKRLLHRTSVSEDAEKSMIAKLKEVCGHDYVSKLQRMFTDVELSLTISEEFKQLGESKIDLSILVLTTGSWPLLTSNSNCILPLPLEAIKESFMKYYINNYSSRKLVWNYQLSKADIKIMFTKRTYECNCTNYQLTILLLFEECPEWTLQAMAKQTQLEAPELKSTVHSLVESKLLKRIEKDGGHVFTLNSNFTSKRVRFKLGTSQFAETKGENDLTKKSIMEDRKFYLQALIVRIMKTRQRIKHSDLIQEVVAMSQSRFQPQISFTKQCVETLIEKEYIGRCGEGEYEYRA